MTFDKRKITNGFAWTAVERSVTILVQFVLTVIIARLLSPKEYGILGLLLVFTEISQVFVDGGMGDALVYRNNLKSSDVHTTFSFNITISFFLSVLLFFTAPYIASFFDLPNLQTYLRLCIIVIMLNSLVVVPTAILKVKLYFKFLALTNFLAITISGLFGVYAALRGLGVYSLIIQIISRSVIQCIILIPVSHWLPKFKFDIDSLKGLFRYGSNLFGANILTRIVEQSTSFFIGKVFNPYDLGLYTRGQSFAYIPSNVMMMVGTSVLFPAMSSFNNVSNKEKFVMAYKKIVMLLSIVSTPLIVMVAVLAHPLIHLLLTDKWIEIAPLIQILAIGKILFPLSNVSEQCLNAAGRSDLFFRQQIIKMATKLVLILCTLPISLFAVVIAEAAYNILAFFITNFVARPVLGYSPIKQLADVSSILFAAGIALLTGIIVVSAFANEYVQIFVSAAAFLGVYMLLLVLFGKTKILKEAYHIIKRKNA